MEDELILPKTPTQLTSRFDVNSFAEVLQKTRNLQRLSMTQQTIWKYSEKAIVTGRALDSVIIFLAGSSGTGKSSTINCLFNDATLCQTNSFTMETKDSIMVRNRVSVPEETPPVVGYLSFIEVPDVFKVKNTEKIFQLKKFSEELSSRKYLQERIEEYFVMRQDVYPNVILYTVKATENRIGDEDSTFRQSLRAFAQMEIVDMKYPNLIIVLTHAMSLGSNKEKFIDNLKSQVGIIRMVVSEVLGISKVGVIPVENCPADFDLKKSGDFYSLPNGEPSHCNLFDTMINQFRRNTDRLGQLLLGSYFNIECPEERSNGPEVLRIEDLTLITTDAFMESSTSRMDYLRDLITTGSSLFSAISLGFPSYALGCPSSKYVPEYNFQCLGFGYCPVLEEVKPFSLFWAGSDADDSIEMKDVWFGNVKFSVPNYVSIFTPKVKTSHHLSSFMTKEEYERDLKLRFAIDMAMKLILNTSSVGKWLVDVEQSMESSIICLVEELNLATAKLVNPKEHIKSKEFLSELERLPALYRNDDNSDDNNNRKKTFQNFFAKWGTHFVWETSLGGNLQLNCTLEEESCTKRKLQEIEGKLSIIFAKRKGNLHLGNIEEELNSRGVTNVNIQLSGGDPPIPVSLGTFINSPEELPKWWETVENTPAELQRSIKLFPYYNLLDSGTPNFNSLLQATNDYLKNRLKFETGDKNRAQISEDIINKVKTEKPKATKCFPKGTLVLMETGVCAKIEDLEDEAAKSHRIQTLAISRKETIYKIRCGVGATSETNFCTYLDRKSDDIGEYLVLECANGKKLTVSEYHLIFEYVGRDGPGNNGMVQEKQAKHLNLGDKLVYWNTTTEGHYEMARITSISKEFHVGAYSPLTTAGTFFADGFLVSSYANTNSFAVAQGALLPLKVWGRMKMLVRRKNKGQEETQSKVSCDQRTNLEGIHPYAKFLIYLRQAISTVRHTKAKTK